MLRVRAALAVVIGAVWGAAALAGCTRTVDASRAIGLPCGSTASCANLCLSPVIYPGGFCSRTCQLDAECPVGALCANSVCLFACFDDDDCSQLVDGWSCRDLAGKLVCAPDGLTLPDAGAIPDA